MLSINKLFVYSQMLCLCLLMRLSSAISHCKLQRYENSYNSTHMQFTKEVADREYVLLGQFKSLHCCAKGYRVLEWYKNGQPYPWPSDESSFILYPEDANQTIYTRSATKMDKGNYTCVLQDDDNLIEHFIDLNIETNTPDRPLATYKPKDQIIPLNGNARTYCEAFVGDVKLPDVKNTISWYKVEKNISMTIIPDENQIDVRREDGQIIGAVLKIRNMKESDYGNYLCRIEINNEKHRLDMYSKFVAEPSVSQLSIYIKLILIITPIFILTSFIFALIIYKNLSRFKFTKNKVANARLTNPSCIEREERKYRQFFKQFCRQLSKSEAKLQN